MEKRIVLSLVVLLAISGFAPAATRLVPDDYDTIQAAIDAAVDGDEVVVADGIYVGDDNRDLLINRDIIIRSENGPDRCIIDCNGTKSEHHWGFGNNKNCTIAGFTIINGYTEEGSAIRCGSGSPTVINCVLSDNFAERRGGAVYCHNTNLTAINCTITGNSAECGGGIYSEYSNLNIKNCTIKDNLATGDREFLGGGGIHCANSSVTIINSHIEQNSASSGGGIYCCSYSSLIVNNCTIGGNLAKAEGSWGKDSSHGGGICCRENSNLVIIGSTISDNIAKVGDGAGGGIYFYGSDSKLTIDNTIITGNTVKGGYSSKGGGIFYDMDSWSSDVSIITNCTINSNLAEIEKDEDRSYGGGIYFRQGRPIIAKCKISNNSATEGCGITCEQSSTIIAGCIISGNFSLDGNKYSGGGIQCKNSNTSVCNCTIVGNSLFGLYRQDGSTNVTNSILYYNGRDNQEQIAGSGYVNVIYSDVQRHKPENPPWPGEGNIHADPCFIESGYWDVNGTPIQWEDDFWVEGNYRLLPMSPCIDTGCSTSLLLDSTDLDGYPRLISRIDMGAYEFIPPIEVALKLTPPVLNLRSGGKWLKAHLVLPEGFSIEDVDANTPAVIEPYGIESYKIKVLLNDEGLVRVEATFNRSDLCGAITSYDQSIEVTVIGRLTTGQEFYGTDTVRIIGRRWRHPWRWRRNQ